ncbi:hypothetical protein [Streptomyces sp. cmx-18-6]|uniref:DoxX family protein n=1 Tax=Streptomyces sp. cmx-18-6 TaxID=2790930 RepID=UPI00397FDC71
MEPLVALAGTTCIALIIGAFSIRRSGRTGRFSRLHRLPTALRAGLAAMFLLTGGAHFIGMRDELIAMVPPALPSPGLLVTLTGIAELAAALALLWRRTSGPAAGLLTFLLIAMFPANVYAADTAETWWDELIPRTLTQLVFLTATITVLADRLRPKERTAGAGPYEDRERRPGHGPDRAVGRQGDFLAEPPRRISEPSGLGRKMGPND